MQYIKRVKKLEERFNLPGFMEYLQNTFSGFENPFLRQTIEKIVWHAHLLAPELRNHWIAYYIKDHISDDVELTEIINFVIND